MKDMIEQIVEADRKAQALVNQAEQEKQQAAEELIQKRRDMAKDARTKADAKIEKRTEELRLEAEKKWKNKQEIYDGVRKKLQQDYQSSKEQWVGKIVGRVLGK